MAEALPLGGTILEIGSGPGWDADFLEALGAKIRRTDVTEAFRTIQAERGEQVDSLDLLTDDITGRYPGILMLCVIQHFERTQVDAALRKLAGALTDRGILLLSHPVGDEDLWERGTSGDYRVVRWPGTALDKRLAANGFVVEREWADDGEEGVWRTVLARKGTSCE